MQRKLNEKLKVNKNIATRKKDFAVKVHRIIIKFRKTISFRIMNKITVKLQNPATDICLENF